MDDAEQPRDEQPRDARAGDASAASRDAAVGCTAAPEVCDDRDNDCDQMVDENDVCRAITQISVGESQACALRASGAVACWSSEDASPVVVEVQGIKAATEVAVGGAHACALLSDGTVRCWGAGAKGQLGDGKGIDSATPVIVAAIRDVRSIATGANTSCAVHADGTLSCWGFHMLFDGTHSAPPKEDFYRTARPVNGLSNVRQLALGTTHACALIEGGRVSCWGTETIRNFGDTGALGRPTQVVVADSEPLRVEGVSAISAIAAGYHSSCALQMSGAALCWGDIDAERDESKRGEWASLWAVPRKTPPLAGAVREIGLGERIACARLDSGRVQCFGVHGVAPADVLHLDGVEDLAVGGTQGCARLVNGAVACWRLDADDGIPGPTTEIVGLP